MQFPNINQHENVTCLILRQLHPHDFWHIAILYHQYRVFYEQSQLFCEELNIFIANYVQNKILSQQLTIDSFEEMLVRPNFPQLDDEALTSLYDFCRSTQFLAQRLRADQSTAFTIYVRNDNSHIVTPSIDATAASIVPELGIQIPEQLLKERTSSPISLANAINNPAETITYTPIAFLHMACIFSTVKLATDFWVNDLFAHSSIRNIKCGSTLLYQAIGYTRDVLKPLNNNVTRKVTSDGPRFVQNPITLAIRTQFTNAIGQYLYPHVGFIQVQKDYRTERYIYEMEL